MLPESTRLIKRLMRMKESNIQLAVIKVQAQKHGFAFAQEFAKNCKNQDEAERAIEIFQETGVNRKNVLALFRGENPSPDQAVGCALAALTFEREANRSFRVTLREYVRYKPQK